MGVLRFSLFTARQECCLSFWQAVSVVSLHLWPCSGPRSIYFLHEPAWLQQFWIDELPDVQVLSQSLSKLYGLLLFRERMAKLLRMCVHIRQYDTAQNSFGVSGNWKSMAKTTHGCCCFFFHYWLNDANWNKTTIFNDMSIMVGIT